MDKLKQQVKLAHRRLVAQQFVAMLPGFLVIALSVAAVAVLVPKLVPVTWNTELWTWAWIGGSAAAGMLAAGLWTLLRRRSALDAAIEIDHRFGLKERVSSALALSADEQESAAGQALVADASRRIEGLDVGDRFGVRPGRRSLLPLVPAAIALLVATLLQDRAAEDAAAAQAAALAEQQQVKQSTEVLRRRVAKKREEAMDKGLKDAEDLFKKLEDGTKKLGDKKEVDREKAMVKLNDLARDLEKRRDHLAGNERLKQQLAQMKDIDQGPADRLADAMRKGDMKKALDELRKLQDQLKNNELDKDAAQQLAQQLKQMKDKLAQAADAHKQAMDQLAQQLEDAKKAGNAAKANELQKQLDKLAQQAPAMDALKKIAQQMDQASKDLKNGQGQKAADSLDQIAQDLKAMKQQADEAAMLDDMLDQIAQAKDSMACKNCGGAGCEKCRGAGWQQGLNGGQGEGDGDGLGKGQGHGARPEEKTDTAAYDSRVRQNVGKGAATVTDLVDGPNVKGNVLEEVKAEIEAARREKADPLTGERLPRTHREHAREYFDAFRKGQ